MSPRRYGVSANKASVLQALSQRLRKELPPPFGAEEYKRALASRARRHGRRRRGHAVRVIAGRHLLPHGPSDGLVPRRRPLRMGAGEWRRSARRRRRRRSSSTTRTRACWRGARPTPPTSGSRRTSLSRRRCASWRASLPSRRRSRRTPTSSSTLSRERAGSRAGWACSVGATGPTPATPRSSGRR